MNNGMKISKRLKTVLIFFNFLVLVTAAYLLIPRENRFERYFEVGKPWSYDLLTAPMDFAIYKSDEQVESERDSVMMDLVPYFNMEESVAQTELVSFVNAGTKLGREESVFVSECLRHIYSCGVMQLSDMQDLQRIKVSNVEVVSQNNMASQKSILEIYTQRSAYDYIIETARNTSNIDDNIIRTGNVDKYIKPNLILDTTKTKQAEMELLNSVILTSGMVQKGERIIDRGEVVTPRIFRILTSLQRADDGDTTRMAKNSWMVFGDIAVIAIIYLLMFVYLYLFRSAIFNSGRAILFMQFMSLGMLALLSVVLHYTSLSEYIVPFAMLPLVIRVFFDSRTALYIHIITVLIASMMVPDPVVFMLLQILAGMVAVSSLKNMDSRAQLIRSAALVFVVYVVAFSALQLSNGVQLGEFDLWIYLVFFINSVSLLFAYGLIFIIEKTFGFLSGVTLVELSNINNPLLMQFSEKCPGTFQHVLQVSNLAVEVAKKINADALLIRTGALYHDLGKMINPIYFTENQTSDFNPLNEMSYEQAAQVVITHVAAGVKIAQKENLPKQIIDFIATHHGNGKTKYFYNSFKNKYPDKEIDESVFSYPGPLPSTKETAVLMMADAVEAASRSLKSYDEAAIDKLVEGIVNGQIADGMFKNTPLSFRDVETAKMVFKDKLKNIYHTRISYPELNSKPTSSSGLNPLSSLSKIKIKK